jgi:micrococcal nuclease
VDVSRPRAAVLAAVAVLALVAAVLVVAWVAGAVGDDEAAGGDAPAGQGFVVKIVDGDTLDVELASGAVERVRLVGIDTPESVAPDQPVECYGPEATGALKELLPVGTTVRLERDREARDRYGRLLAYVFRVDDGLFVNEALAAAGDADVLTIPPNTVYAQRLSAAVRSAQAAGAGMWGACPHR